MKTPAPVARHTDQSSTDGSAQVHRVLVVDADESSRSVLAVALGREGFETVVASSSSEAMRWFGPGRAAPHLLVVAAGLQQESGFAFVAQLRGDRSTGNLPVLLLAKGDEPHFHQLSRVVGADEIILKPAYARDIATLARLQLAPAGIDGTRILDAAVNPVVHTLRAVLTTSRSGVIELEKGRGHIAYRRGKVLDASFDGVHGLNGLVRALALVRGAYKVTARPLAFDPSFHFTLKELVSVVLPRLQRWDELVVRSLPLDAKLGVDFAALARALPSMPDAVNSVVRLFDGLRDVREVLMDSPLDETVTLEIATRLYLMGVVLPVDASQTLGFGKADPHLFEPRPTEAVERMDSLFSTNPTPIQVSDADATDEDWEHDAQGTGLEDTDPAAGWAASTTAAIRLGIDHDQDLTAEVQEQLSAFNIQPVVEHEAAPPFARELYEFAAGEAAEERPMEEALARPMPIPLTQLAAPELTIAQQDERALENEFFSVEQTPAQQQDEAPSVSAAVLGLSTTQAQPAEQGRLGSFGMLVIAGLVVTTAGITAWQRSGNDEPPLLIDPPVAAAVQAEMIEVAVAPTATVEVLEPVMAGAPVPVPASAALVAATRLYDTGQYLAAARALEKITAEDPTNTQAWLMLGFTRFDNGDPAGAAEAANTALAIDPAKARAHLLRATILISARDRAQANVEIQKYLELDPQGEFADEAKALLKR